MSDRAPTLFITQELLPFHATGGMAVLSRDLPEALIGQGWPHCYLLPYVDGITALPDHCTRQPLLSGSVRVDDVTFDYRIFWLVRPAQQGDVFFVAQDEVFSGRIYDDTFRLERNLIIADAALALLQWHKPRFGLVHALDQLSALSLACIRTAAVGRIGLIFNILSAEYDFPLSDTVRQREFANRGALANTFSSALTSGSAIELGLKAADRTVTSSPPYAEALKEKYTLQSDPGTAGLVGISQGIDTSIWNPMAEGRLFHPVRRDSILQDKQRNRRILSAILANISRFTTGNLSLPDVAPTDIIIAPGMLLSFVGRFCRAKGRSALYQVIDMLDQFPGIELLLLIPEGAVSEVDLVKLRTLTEASDRLRVIVHYDQALAELVFAASDYVLMPSEQEPGGLCQKMAMRFGALPVVTPAGGLKSSVTDLFAFNRKGNGFMSDTIEAESYIEKLQHVLAFPADAALLQAGRGNAMATDVSWEPTIGAYDMVYRALTQQP